MYRYKTLVVGGTFDILHEGHKALLRFAFSLAEYVYVTITSDAYTKIHKPHASSFVKRSTHLATFLKNEYPNRAYKILPIDDVYGIADTSIHIDAIAATTDTKSGAEKVNEKRKKMGFSPLKIEMMPMVSSEIGIPLSSTRIRNGIFNEKGTLQVKTKIITDRVYLPEGLRKFLSEPFGRFITSEEIKTFPKEKLIAVGDVTTKKLHKAGIFPQLCIIDFLIERKKQNHSLSVLGFFGDELLYHVPNPASSITPALWECISLALQLPDEKRKIIIVDGEEDLAVLPAVLLAPFGYMICYGQPHRGMVAIEADVKAKEFVLDILSQFQSTTRGH